MNSHPSKTAADPVIRVCDAGERDALRTLVLESFDGVTLEQDIEEALGILHGHDWRWRKARHVDDDLAAYPAGVFVAVIGDTLVGCVTTRIDTEAGRGRIPNLAVAKEWRGRGLGRRLIEFALDGFRRHGLTYAVIETMAQNEIGAHLYPSCGFVEVARQIHYARRL